MGHWTDSTFATRSALIGADDLAYARAKLAAGVPRSHIAKMMGRSLAMVKTMLPEAPVRSPPACLEEPPADEPVRFPGAMLKAGAAIAHKHGMPLALIRSQSRIRVVSLARQELCWTIYQLRNEDGTRRFSQPQIARFVGLRDHTPVHHAIQVFEARRLSTSDVFSGAVAGDEHPKREENQSGEAVFAHQPHPSEAQAMEA